MSTVILRKALEVKLKEFAVANGNIPIAYEEIKFEQSGKPIWLRPVLYQSDTINPSIGDNLSRKVGFMQVNVCIPDGSGMLAAESLCDKLVEFFHRGMEIYREGLYIQIPRTPYAQAAYSLNTIKTIPMVVRYSVDVF